MRYIFLIAISFIICFAFSLSGDEKELDAIKIELVEVSPSDVRLVCFFDNATITTYFKKSLRKNFFFSLLPLHQEFLYHPTKQIFTSKNYENRLWDDGVAGYAFRYDGIKIKDYSKNFNHIYTTINDEYAKTSFQARYTISGGESLGLEIFEE